jgi:hypothetical protein
LNPILFVGKKGKPGKDDGKKKKEKQGKAKVRVPPSLLQSSKTKGDQIGLCYFFLRRLVDWSR